jgi:signal transduction histidine kinase
MAGGAMLESEFLIYDKRAGVQHVQTALAFAFILALTSLAIFPYRLILLPRIVAFVPVIDTMHLLFNGIIATVLFSLASILRSKPLIALGTGYVFIGLIAVAHALTYPDTFSRTGLLGAHFHTVTWLYLAWHVALPASIIAYALLKNSPHELQNPAQAPARTIFVCLAAAAIAAAATTWLTTAGDHLISNLLDVENAHYILFLVLLLTGAALILLWRGQHSILDLCLMLTLWAWFLEYALLPGAGRFSVGWYAGRVMGLLSGMFVLLMLLIEMSRLYARTVLLIAAHKRERENRLLLGEAVGAFIAHELRQPLAAISLTAFTAQKVGARVGGELSVLMDDLIEDSRRANAIIQSTRAIFGTSGGQKCPTDVNQLVRNTLLMMSRELKNHDVKVEVQLNDHLPLCVINPTQMQQVLVNLFINAAEAMGEVAGRPRKLSVKSSSTGAGLIIRVEDTGPSIIASDRDRIFDPFFTTKKHGTGMGLSICRSILDAHGGSIQMVPGTPFGTRFEIYLPKPDTAASAQG